MAPHYYHVFALSMPMLGSCQYQLYGTVHIDSPLLPSSYLFWVRQLDMRSL
jgi:hypothetical protein